MKLHSHKTIAAIVAFIVIAINVGYAIGFGFSAHWAIVLSINIAAFIATYSFVRYLLRRFVITQISPIYKTIYNVDTIRKKMRAKPNADNLVEQVNRDVVDWAEEKTKEISRLSAMERYRKEFLGNVSHELKTPTFAIQGQVLTLLDGGLEDPTINRKYLESCERNIERLISLIQELETINKLETGEIPLHKTTFNLATLVEEIFEVLQGAADKRAITLCLKTPANNRVMVFADRQRISQIVMNLVANSISYGSDGGKTTVGFSDMPDRVLVEVQDNGIGISEDNLPRIFERFYRVDKHRSREYGGTGLGLAIVKHIVEAHNQSINVKSELGKGAIFAFTLDKPKTNNEK